MKRKVDVPRVARYPAVLGEVQLPMVFKDGRSAYAALTQMITDDLSTD